MLSSLITATLESIALINRFNKRKSLISLAESRLNYYRKQGINKSFIVVNNCDNSELDRLKKLPTDSSVVFVDCALEKCNTEQDLIKFWDELKRVSGANDSQSDNLFVMHIQKWSNSRLTFDPRIRWVILEAPPTVKEGKIKYKPFGIRSTVLADTKIAGIERRKLNKSNA